MIVLGRAGEDNKSFRLTDVDQTLQGFAGADYNLQVGGGGQVATCRWGAGGGVGQATAIHKVGLQGQVRGRT